MNSDETAQMETGVSAAAAAATAAQAVPSSAPEPIPPVAVAPVALVRPGALYGLVFFAGIGTMATEMCASRLLAPYFGSSTMIWANIIGLILMALSLGYVIGGRLADRWPSPRLLGFIVLAGAVITAVVPFVARPFLNVTINGIDSVSTGAVLGSFFACVILFVPSVLLLGMVTPFAIRIGIRDMDKAGSTAGRIFALSTAGSLLGHLPARRS